MVRGSALTRTDSIEGSRPGSVSAFAKPTKNGLLAALPVAFARWGTELEPVVFTFGQVLWTINSLIPHVYFPTSATISLHGEMKSGSAAEVAIVGREGMVGVAVVMGSDLTWSRAVVQSAGEGFRLKSSVVKAELGRTVAVRNLLLRYIQALMTQITQIAVCNRLHCLDKQFSRRLLVSLDRLSSEELTMTHGLIASALGVRREGVTQAAVKLQKAGIISYSRGHIAVLDRPGLEAASCECYSVVKREYDRLLADRSH
jgi:hypothetical protein